MKYTFLFALLLFAQICFGQKNDLVKVAGTKCSMVPPEGFVTSSSFSGFQNNEWGASIMINEIPAPYQSIVDGFTAEALKTRGMTLIDKQIIDFNNAKAALYSVSQPANGTVYLKQMLVFGDANLTVLVNGIYPEASKSIESKMKEALLSTVLDKAQSENPLEAAAFSIDVANTEFKLIRYISGALLYSTDGKIPTDKPTLIVANSIAKVAVENQKKYAEDRIKKLPGGDQTVIKQVHEVRIDDLKGYEIIADGKTKDNLPELIYQVMLFNEKGDYYIIIGQAKEAFEKYLQTFKQISKSFTVK